MTRAWEWETFGFCFRSLILPHIPFLAPFCTSEQPGLGTTDSDSSGQSYKRATGAGMGELKVSWALGKWSSASSLEEPCFTRTLKSRQWL